MVFFNFQPTYLMEVYEANGFEPTRTFINYYPQHDEWHDRPMLYREYRYGDEIVFREPCQFTNICFLARKARAVERLTKPLQGFYRRYHGERNAGSQEGPAVELDGRLAAEVKKRVPGWLLKSLLSLNRLRLRIEESLLPYSLRDRLWCWRRRRFLRALDRVRKRTILRI
jgi:hypothetical protein